MIDAKDLVEFFDELGLSEQVVEGNRTPEPLHLEIASLLPFRFLLLD